MGTTKDKNADEFLKSIGITDDSANENQKKNQDVTEHPASLKKGRKAKGEAEASESKNLNFRIYISKEEKIKFALLGISPRVLCEDYIKEYLNREDVKEEIKIKLRDLK